jgi:hypothetical protein
LARCGQLLRALLSDGRDRSHRANALRGRGTAGQLTDKNHNRLIVEAQESLGALNADPMRLTSVTGGDTLFGSGIAAAPKRPHVIEDRSDHDLNLRRRDWRFGLAQCVHHLLI